MIPKYRVWNETAGLANVINIDFREKELKVSHWEYGDSIYFPLDEVDLMQSTGFHDAKGTEIFVGDIVIHTQKSINYGDVYHNDYAEVFQQQNGAYRIRGKHIYEMDAFCNRKRLEVVGNIFENVELLDHDSFTTEK